MKSKLASWWTLTLILVGLSIALPAFLLGAELAKQAGLKNTIFAVYGAGLLWAIVAVALGKIGVEHRKSTYELMKAPFGTYGGKLLSLIILITFAGWYAINCEIFGDLTIALLQNTAYSGISKSVIIITAGILMSWTAVIGFRTVKVYSIVSVPLLFTFILLAVAKTLSITPLNTIFNSTDVAHLDAFDALALTTGGLILAALVSSDLTQYVKNETHAAIGLVLGFFVGAPTVILIAAILASGTHTVGLVEAIVALGLSVFAFPVLALSVWDTNDTNLFSASLASVAIFDGIARWKLALVIAVISTGLALSGAAQNMQGFLIFLSIAVPSMGGVLWAHFRFAGNRQIIWAAFSSYFLGTLVTFLSTPSIFGGAGLLRISAIPAIDGIIVSSFAYWVILKMRHRTA